MVAVLAVLALFDGAFVPFAYLGLFGLGSGMLQPMMSGFLATPYGVANYGAIRAVSSAIMALSTAAAPASFAWTSDAGVGIGRVPAGGPSRPRADAPPPTDAPPPHARARRPAIRPPRHAP